MSASFHRKKTDMWLTPVVPRRDSSPPASVRANSRGEEKASKTKTNTLFREYLMEKVRRMPVNFDAPQNLEILMEQLNVQRKTEIDIWKQQQARESGRRGGERRGEGETQGGGERRVEERRGGDKGEVETAEETQVGEMKEERETREKEGKKMRRGRRLRWGDQPSRIPVKPPTYTYSELVPLYETANKKRRQNMMCIGGGGRLYLSPSIKNLIHDFANDTRILEHQKNGQQKKIPLIDFIPKNISLHKICSSRRLFANCLQFSPFISPRGEGEPVPCSLPRLRLIASKIPKNLYDNTESVSVRSQRLLPPL